MVCLTNNVSFISHLIGDGSFERGWLFISQKTEDCFFDKEGSFISHMIYDHLFERG